MPSGSAKGSKATQFKPLAKPLRERFEESYIPEPNSGCWLWIAGVDNKGYGRITISKTGKMHLAHRVAWQLYRRKTKKFVLHHCDNPCCVNPDHLYAGTQKDNMRDRTVRNRQVVFRGEANSRAKLTNQQVVDIRIDNRVQHIIAEEYGVSQSLISYIKLGRKWGHV